ncbi:putative lipid II flippase FtsW [Cohnella thailandensis]|uniref:Probable peptidoglycan glycosyltransferase FtsW n=1 Tax=Cohnella thailandensis TaxID=557557 RepID=A0A841T010_9BACL|nr:putative lipid II flippase FtsW [Cohnella thailandensis]MBB6636439.1 putative lipid II flippase FtsW [Cohnella thailandensis]MBP1973590.1 cell division protein FtsW [Cohnella thailandensis]
MRNPTGGQKGAPDFLLLILTLLLVGFGLVMVFSASSSMTVVSKKFGYDALYFTKRQIMWAGLGTFVMLVLMNVPYAKYKKWFAPFLFLTTLMLMVVPFVASETNGARSWLGIGGLGIQPTEFAKIAIILYLAAIITKKEDKFREFKRGLLPVMIVVGFICGLIMLQPDLGSCVVLILCAGSIIVAGGAHLKQLAMSAAVILGIAALLFSLYLLTNPDFDGDYRIARFTAFLDPMADKEGAGYQLLRSLEAFGHGGFMGTGLGNSVQKLFYLDYAYNDFIFAIIAEELGFFGTTLFLLFFLLFLWRALIVALRCPDNFGTLVGVGMVSLIAIQALINMGGVSSAIPLTGVTLPFISYGGSSLLALMIGMGILLSISREYNREVREPSRQSSEPRAARYQTVRR